MKANCPQCHRWWETELKSNPDLFLWLGSLDLFKECIQLLGVLCSNWWLWFLQRHQGEGREGNKEHKGQEDGRKGTEDGRKGQRMGERDRGWEKGTGGPLQRQRRGGRDTEVSPGLGLEGSNVRSVHFYTWRKILKIRPSDSHCRLRIQLHGHLLLRPPGAIWGEKQERLVLYSSGLDFSQGWQLLRCGAWFYSFIPSFIFFKLFMYLGTLGLSSASRM